MAGYLFQHLLKIFLTFVIFLLVLAYRSPDLSLSFEHDVNVWMAPDLMITSHLSFQVVGSTVVLLPALGADPSSSSTEISEIEMQMASKTVVIGVRSKKPDESPSLRSLKASCSHRKARLDLERSNNSSLSQQIKNLSTKCREREHELNENLLKDQAVQLFDVGVEKSDYVDGKAYQSQEESD
ncbi:hypothetical protein C5167_014431 [Papaver somniferum]|uniref:Uncharacterized protein n=1 Tax=Papaver somniferum TaxID=3469 RepID=A0A4Y7J763_PAPSO|nr:hypothetical protein C5167_014431 [Papaver somniferum]